MLLVLALGAVYKLADTVNLPANTNLKAQVSQFLSDSDALRLRLRTCITCLTVNFVNLATLEQKTC